jgi:hypothetical protein
VSMGNSPFLSSCHSILHYLTDYFQLFVMDSSCSIVDLPQSGRPTKKSILTGAFFAAR